MVSILFLSSQACSFRKQKTYTQMVKKCCYTAIISNTKLFELQGSEPSKFRSFRASNYNLQVVKVQRNMLQYYTFDIFCLYFHLFYVIQYIRVIICTSSERMKICYCKIVNLNISILSHTEVSFNKFP